MTEQTKEIKDQEVDLEEDLQEDTNDLDETVEKNFDATDDIDAIFSGEGLSEEFKSNAKAIFEAAVLAQVEERAKTLEEEYSQRLEEELTSINENLVNKVDEYLEYVVGEWLEENKLAIDSGIKAEIAEDFMVGLKNLFTEHYIDIPEEKVDIVEQFSAKVEELESELDKVIGDNKSLSEEIKSYKKTQITNEISEGLTEVQLEKLKTLSEKIEFVTEEDYKEKVALTRKKYFETVKEEVKVTKNTQILDEDDSDSLEELSPLMEKYVQNISKITRK